jgi:muconolactone delta-isomerase
MLYVTNCEMKQGYPLSDATWLRTVLESMEAVLSYREAGKVVLHVGFAGRQGGAIIWDVDSHEELMGLMSRLPFWHYLHWEVIPALSTEQILGSLKGAMAALPG